MDTRKNILITGANRGIGFGIIRNLIKKFLNKNNAKINIDKSLNFPYNIIITSRSQEKGLESLSLLKQEFPSFPVQEFCTCETLDISNTSTIDSLTKSLKEKNIKLDILVNNAGVYNKSSKKSLETFKFTFDTNLFGTIEITEKLLKENIFNTNAKIINVTSDYGIIHLLEKENLKA